MWGTGVPEIGEPSIERAEPWKEFGYYAVKLPSFIAVRHNNLRHHHLQVSVFVLQR